MCVCMCVTLSYDELQIYITFFRDMRKRKLEYAGHVLRGSSGESHLYLLEGKISGKRARGRPRRTWMNDSIDWTGIFTYG